MCLGKERWMAEQVAQMLNEKCKVLETLSKCQQEVGVNIAWQTDSLKDENIFEIDNWRPYLLGGGVPNIIKNLFINSRH